jgi:hypothetical protein
VLAYGHAVQVGQITCVSREAGVTCKADDGHGFAFEERYDVY